MVFLWVMKPCSLVYGHRPFAVTYCLCLQKYLELWKGLFIHTSTNVPDNTMSLPCKRQTAPVAIKSDTHCSTLSGCWDFSFPWKDSVTERSLWGPSPLAGLPPSVSSRGHIITVCSLLFPPLLAQLPVPLQQCELLMSQHFWNPIELTKTNAIPTVFHFYYKFFYCSFHILLNSRPYYKI